MIRFATIAVSGVIALGGCASPLKFENVTGSWTCPRIDGVCAGIEDIDTGLAGVSAGSPVAPPVSRGSGIGVAGSVLPGGAPSASPIRSADEIARIVLAPMIDANGIYHARRELFAVMAPGIWIEAPATADASPPASVPQASASPIEGARDEK